MSPDTNYRRLAESDTRNRENLFQTRYADHGGWQSGHMDGEGSTPVVSIPATTPDRTKQPASAFRTWVYSTAGCAKRRSITSSMSPLMTGSCNKRQLPRP